MAVEADITVTKRAGETMQSNVDISALINAGGVIDIFAGACPTYLCVLKFTFVITGITE